MTDYSEIFDFVPQEKPRRTRNERNAGRKPSGKVRLDISLRVSPELAEYLKGLDNRSGWIAEQLERIHKENS
jgi:hypothetical protein